MLIQLKWAAARPQAARHGRPRSAGAEAALHKGLTFVALESLAAGIGVAGLHFLLLAIAFRRRALLGQTGLHISLPIIALQALGVGIRIAGLHFLLLTVGMRARGGLCAHRLTHRDGKHRTYRHEPPGSSHTPSIASRIDQLRM